MNYNFRLRSIYTIFYLAEFIEKQGLENRRAFTEGLHLHLPHFELYDIQTYPGELHNLAADPAYGKELKRMADKLKQF